MHPPWGCASNLFQEHHFRECRSNRDITSLRLPVSLLVLATYNNCEFEFRASLWLALNSLGCEAFEMRHRSHTVSAIQCCLFSVGAFHLNYTLELLLALLKLQSHSLLWLSDIASCWGGVLWVAGSAHSHRLCHPCCLGVWWHWASPSWCFTAASCSLLRCHLQDSDSSTCRVVSLWHSPPLPLQHVAALNGQWQSNVSPQQDFKAFLRSLGGILKFILKCRGQKVQSQGSVCY